MLAPGRVVTLIHHDEWMNKWRELDESADADEGICFGVRVYFGVSTFDLHDCHRLHTRSDPNT